MLTKVCCFLLAFLMVCLPIRLAIAAIPEALAVEPAGGALSFVPRMRRMHLRVRIVKKKLTAGKARTSWSQEVRRRSQAGKAGLPRFSTLCMGNFNEAMLCGQDREATFENNLIYERVTGNPAAYLLPVDLRNSWRISA